MTTAIAKSVTTHFKSDTRGFEAGAQKMQAASKQTKTSILDVSSESGKMAGVVGSSFSAFSAAIGVATANVEQLPLAMLGAGGAMAAAFTAGGPWGLAIAGVGVLVGLLSRTDEKAKLAANTLSDKFAKSVEKATEGVKKLRQEREELEAIERARRLGIPEAIALADLKRGREVQAARAAEALARTDALTLLSPQARRGLELTGLLRPTTAEDIMAQALVSGMAPGTTEAALRDAVRVLRARTEEIEETLRVQEMRIRAGKAAGRESDLPWPVPERSGPSVEFIGGDQRYQMFTRDEERRHREAMEQRKRMLEALDKPAKASR